MNSDVLAGMIRDAARDVLAARGLRIPAVPLDAAVRRPRKSEHGDYATSIALRHADDTGVRPAEFARWLAEELAARPGIEAAAAAGPGFVNLTLSPDAIGATLGDAVATGFGDGDEWAGRVVEVSPVPAGPAASMRLGEARLRAVCEACERLLEARGARVVRAPGATPADPPRTSVRDSGLTTVRELVEILGEDAVRYALVRCPSDVPLEIDLRVLAHRTEVNPVFAVQFAHARLSFAARHAADAGVTAGDAFGLLEHPREGDLIRTLGEFPEVVRAAAELREPHRVARYLEALAAAYHRFYDACRVLPMGDEEITELHRARLSLCVAARQVLANGLGLLGVSAPERM